MDFSTLSRTPFKVLLILWLNMSCVCVLVCITVCVGWWERDCAAAVCCVEAWLCLECLLLLPDNLGELIYLGLQVFYLSTFCYGFFFTRSNLT